MRGQLNLTLLPIKVGSLSTVHPWASSPEAALPSRPGPEVLSWPVSSTLPRLLFIHFSFHSHRGLFLHSDIHHKGVFHIPSLPCRKLNKCVICGAQIANTALLTEMVVVN